MIVFIHNHVNLVLLKTQVPASPELVQPNRKLTLICFVRTSISSMRNDDELLVAAYLLINDDDAVCVVATSL